MRNLCTAATLISLGACNLGVAETVTLYVSPHGNDAWSGLHAEPNALRTDGPVATLHRARDLARNLKRELHARQSITIKVRQGTYCLDRPLVLGPEDSGAPGAPITYRPYDGETVVISGGRRITGKWTSDGTTIQRIHLPDVKAGNWWFRQLRVGDQRRPQARFPDAPSPVLWEGDFLYVGAGGERMSGFGIGLGCLQEKGTWLEYEIEVPRAGEYAIRVFYANNGDTNMRFFKFRDMSGRTTFSFDGAPPIHLADLTDTGSFYEGFRWARSGAVRLTKGKHVVRWSNPDGGALSLDAFMLCTDPEWEPQADTDATPAGVVIWQAELFDRKQGDLVRTQLYFDRKDPARRRQFEFAPGDLAARHATPDAELFVIPEYDWVSELVRLTAVDETRHIARVDGPNCTKPLVPGNRYCVLNAPAVLDQPGEWCLVRKTGTLCYWPKTTAFTGKDIVAPVLDRVIELRDCQYVHIEGFTFTDTCFTAPERIGDTYHADDAALWLWNARHCRIAGNTFRDVGGYGVMLRDGAAHSEIVENDVVGAGQGGIYVNGFTDTMRRRAPDGHRPAHNLIAGNNVHHCGIYYVHVAGVYLACADHTTVAHNNIHHMPRYGISLKQACPGSVVEYNDVRWTNLATRDTGAIEMAGNKAGTVVRFNLVADAVGSGYIAKLGRHASPCDAGGIYLDNMSSNVHVHGNIIVRTECGIWLNWGSDNIIENNIIVDSRAAHAFLSAWSKNGWKTQGNIFRRNILYHSRPDAATYRISGWNGTNGGVRLSDNVIWSAGAEPRVTGAKQESGSTWRWWTAAGLDAGSQIMDPGFVAPDAGDFRLADDASALAAGFPVIDVTRIGQQGYRKR